MTQAAAVDFFNDIDFGGGEEISDGGDFLGGSQYLDSDVYLFTITEAFLTESSSGAKAMNFLFETEDGQKLRQQCYMTTNKAKGCKTFYIIQRTGEKRYLPGYTIAKHISMLCAQGKEVNQLVREMRTVKLYDYDKKQEVPTDVPMCVELLGKQILAAVVKRVVDRQKDSGAKDDTGATIYIPTGETRTENEVVKVFRVRDRKTVTEIKAQDAVPKAVFIDQWLEKWKGQVEDKSTKTSGNPGSPGNGNAGAPPSNPDVNNLFQ